MCRLAEGISGSDDQAPLQQLCEHRATFPSEVDPDEIGIAGRVLEPESLERPVEVVFGLLVQRPRSLNLVAVLEARKCGRLCDAADVERLPHAFQRVGQLGRRRSIPDAQARQPVDLRERAKHDCAPSVSHQRQRVGIVRIVNVLVVGFIHDQYRAVGERLQKLGQLLPGDDRPSWVIRIADEHDFSPRGHPLRHRRRVVPEFSHRYVDRDPVHQLGRELVLAEGARAHHHFIAGRQEGEPDVMYQLIAAVAQQNLSAGKPQFLGEGRPEMIAVVVRIEPHVSGRLADRLDCLRGGSQWILI